MGHSELDFDNEDEEYGTHEFDADDSEPTIDCPYCGKEILETTPRCPHCERWISEEDGAPQKKSWLVIVGTGLCLYVVYRWIAG
jgi:hypothetical protein